MTLTMPTRTTSAKQRQGIFASALLLIVLAISTFFSTKSESFRLRTSFTDVSSNYVPLVKSLTLPVANNNVNINNGRVVKDDAVSSNGNSRHSLANAEDDDVAGEEEDSTTTNDDDHDDDNHMAEFYEQIVEQAVDDDFVVNDVSSRIKSILEETSSTGTGSSSNQEVEANGIKSSSASPACHPHFNVALPKHKWNNTTKFKRIYFYHARKAGGSTMHKYLGAVAEHYGIELKAVEWLAMEEPGSREYEDDGATFYVTHLREPVDRAISHFKYQGRWDCRDLVHSQRGFTPTEENANNLETWDQTGGHVPYQCKQKGSRKTGERYPFFFMGNCAVNCYTQWFSGLSCSEWNIPLEKQYQVAKSRILRYNMIVVIEKLRDPEYVKNVEDFFGVPGLNKKGTPYCERQSHSANAKYPLIVRNKTRANLRRLNEVDIQLYHEMTDCLGSMGGQYNFPKWNSDRFVLNSFNSTEAKLAKKRAKEQKLGAKEQKLAASSKKRLHAL